MKAYGHNRRDKLECKYGCCTFKSGKHRPERQAVDKTKRKSARAKEKVLAEIQFQEYMDYSD